MTGADLREAAEFNLLDRHKESFIGEIQYLLEKVEKARRVLDIEEKKLAEAEAMTIEEFIKTRRN